MSREQKSISYDRWKHKVDRHIRYLVGKDTRNLDNFLYREYYDNDFSPKVVAFFAVKNSYDLGGYFHEQEVWKRELNKFLYLFLEANEYLDNKTLSNLYYQGLQPIWIAESILQQKGYLPEPKCEFGVSPPKF